MLSKISIAMTKREVEEIMFPGTDAEVVKSILTACRITPIKYTVVSPTLKIFKSICERQNIEYPHDVLDLQNIEEHYEIELRKVVENKKRVEETWKVIRSLRFEHGELSKNQLTLVDFDGDLEEEI